MNATVTLLARILLSIIFVWGGFGKLTDAAGTAGYMGSMGLPSSTALAYLVGLFELLGGLAILVGFQTRIAGFALAAFCIVTALLAHANFSDQLQTIMFLKNLGLAGGFLLLAAGGAGAYSVDARKR